MHHPKPSSLPTQEFTISRAAESGFTRKGLRSFWEYRDLGVAAGTHGLMHAHVLRPVLPCPPGGTGWHFHEVDVQFFYVLKGELTSKVEGRGELTFRAGDTWLQPSGTRHCVMHYSEDLELLELIGPADFGTVECEPAG